jgi:hypothetical protein
MSACTRCRWGTGTTCEKVVDTEASLQMKQRLAEIQKQRAALDAMWTPLEEEEKTTLVVKEPVKLDTQIKNSKEIHTLSDLKAERERQDSMWK